MPIPLRIKICGVTTPEDVRVTAPTLGPMLMRRPLGASRKREGVRGRGDIGRKIVNRLKRERQKNEKEK